MTPQLRFSKFGIFSEGAAIGSQVGDAYRPSGMTGAGLVSEEKARVTPLDPKRQPTASKSIHASYRLNISGELSSSDWLALILEALSSSKTSVTVDGVTTDTHIIGGEPSARNYGAYIAIEGDEVYRLAGMRAGMFSVGVSDNSPVEYAADFVALRKTLDAASAPIIPLVSNHSLSTRINTSIKLGVGGATPVAIRPAGSVSVSIESEVEAVNFDDKGRATGHHQDGGTDLVGRFRAILSPSQFDLALGKNFTGHLLITFLDGALEFDVPAATIRLQDRRIIGDDWAEGGFDFVANATTNHGSATVTNVRQT